MSSKLKSRLCQHFCMKSAKLKLASVFLLLLVARTIARLAHSTSNEVSKVPDSIWILKLAETTSFPIAYAHMCIVIAYIWPTDSKSLLAVSFQVLIGPPRFRQHLLKDLINSEKVRKFLQWKTKNMKNMIKRCFGILSAYGIRWR